MYKSKDYERDKPQRDNQSIRIRDVDAGTESYGDIFQEARCVTIAENFSQAWS